LTGLTGLTGLAVSQIRGRGRRALGGTPTRPMAQQYSVVRGFIVAMTSLLAGASVVHNIYKPNLEIPDLGDAGPEAAAETAGG